VRALVLLALLSGCLPDYSTEPRPGQEAAVGMLWSMYRGVGALPEVRWVTGRDLNCFNATSGRNGFFVWPFDCLGGLTLGGHTVYAAWRDGDAMSDTTVHHELFHAALARRGDFDPLHLRGEWSGIVATAFNAEMARGL